MKTYAIEFKNGKTEYVQASSRKAAFMKKFELAREAGFDPHDMSADFTCNIEDIERFANLIRAAVEAGSGEERARIVERACTAIR